MKHIFAFVVAILLTGAFFGIVNAGPASEWVSLSSDAESELKQKIKSEVEKRDTFSTSQEESANLRTVEEEKSKEDSGYKSSIAALTVEFNKYKKDRDGLTTQFQAASTEFEELQKEFKNIKNAIENYDSQIVRYELDIKTQKESFTKWLKTEKQGEAVVAVIYTRGFKDVAHELEKQADTASAPLMAAQMGTYVKSYSTVINSVLVKDVIKGTEEGTAKWNGEEPLRMELDKGAKGTVYLRIKRYELYPFQAPASGKINGSAASDKMSAASVQTMQDLEAFLSKNGYAPKSLVLSRVETWVKEAGLFNQQADTALNFQNRAFEEKISRLNEKITNSRSDKELQLSALKRKEPAYKKMEAELDALRMKKDEAEKLLSEAQSRLSDKKHTRETVIIKTALVTPSGSQTPAEAVAEMVMDKLSDVKNDARVQHSTSTVTVVNSQLAGETVAQAVTEAKIKGVRLISFINEGDSVKVKMAFRVKTVLINEIQSAKKVAEQYTDNGNGTVTANKTGLIWQKQDNNKTRDWSNAMSYCDGLILAGYSDWRLPSKDELETLVDRSKSSPSIDTTFFPNTISSVYWSSTTYAGLTTNAWYVNFDYGYTFYNNKTNTYYARCVRGGQ
ncbi:MAG: hypothetical protein HW415_137 [Deltaproteobacteria bacterium]|nr:hypothetical protein [Deltaproteobacteria bacterium]